MPDAAFADIYPHGFQDARPGFFDSLSDSIHAGEVIAVSVVAAPLVFHGDRISKQFHASTLPHYHPVERFQVAGGPKTRFFGQKPPSE